MADDKPLIQLVSNARPLDKPAKYEVAWLNEVHRWIQEDVLPNAARKRTRPIDDWRTGRVLFVDGPRGAGKTSFLLTMLNAWDSSPGADDVRRTDRNSGAPSASARPEERWKTPIAGLTVLHPVLDFDPLPASMPLHAWLLEPWRLHLKHPSSRSSTCDESDDLHEKLANLAERAILGFTSLRAEDANAVAKALAYRDQASGLLDTQREWDAFVGAVVCQAHGCRREKCTDGHPQLFVVAIDDVDLQVEKIPALLHAVRLLWHPNVLYVLTGDLRHLRFILELDYAAQHRHIGLSGEPGFPKRDAPPDVRIQAYSEVLQRALVEKAIPDHSVVRLRRLTSEEILDAPVEPVPGIRVPKSTTPPTVASCLGSRLSKVFKKLKHERLCTARHLEHAIDKFARSATDGRDSGERSELLASDICALEAVGPSSGEGPLTIERQSSAATAKGMLITEMGSTIRELPGDRLSVVLAERPRVVFVATDEQGRQHRQPEAQGAFLLQIAREEGMFASKRTVVEWQPVAGFLATRATWNSSVDGVEGEALFHWPWLSPPTATQLSDAGALVERLKSAIQDNSLRNLTVDLPLRWIEINISWWEEQESKRRTLRATTGSIAQRWQRVGNKIQQIRNHRTRGERDPKKEVARWTAELALLTAPYMGLPNDSDNSVAGQVRDAVLRINREVRQTIRSERSELRAVIDAIIAAQTPDKVNPGSLAFARAARAFLRQRKELDEKDEWWTWLDEPVPSATKRRPTMPKPRSKPAS